MFPAYSIELAYFSTTYPSSSAPSPYGGVYAGSYSGTSNSIHCRWLHGDVSGGLLALLQRPALTFEMDLNPFLFQIIITSVMMHYSN